MPPGLGPRFVRHWTWLQRIPHRFFSAEIGLVKPDEAFYRHVLNRTGWNPHEVLFVDDLPANVDAAAQLGFQTLLFTGSEEDLRTVAVWARPQSA
jgi:FMN phosphatase YigB (HAD superfamily)